MRAGRGVRLAWWPLLGIALLVVGCGSPPPPAEGTPAAEPSAQPDSLAACAALDLRTPSGEPVDLTGTWEGGIFDHHVRQVGDCVWWIGYARWPGTDPGELATLTFFGRLANDFTVSGHWSTIVRPLAAGAYYSGPQEGAVAFQIGLDPDTGAPKTLTLVGAGSTDRGYPSDQLRLTGPLPESANPPQQ